MLSQKRKKKTETKTATKSESDCLWIKTIFEKNEPSTNTQSADLQKDLRVSLEIIQSEETSNYYHPDNVPNENNSEYSNVPFNGIPEKNQSK